MVENQKQFRKSILDLSKNERRVMNQTIEKELRDKKDKSTQEIINEVQALYGIHPPTIQERWALDSANF